MAGLSRDILKWLQSLDLSYSVKNVKRDFANGFLVAEIFSRYFPHEIQMHSYDNGISLPKKLANWELLEKFFLRKRVPIGRDMIDMVIHCKGNAALPLLETIYTCLTSKKVQNVRASNDDELIPPFARATASFEVKQNIKDSELITTLQDENTKNNRTAELLQDHDRTLRQERLLEPGRFTAAAPQRSSQRVAPRPMQSEVPAGQIEFKEVQVRTLDKQNITQLRASRGPGGDRSTSMGGDGGDQSTLTDRQAGEIAVKSVKPVTAILKSCVPDDIIEKLAADEREPIVAMVDALAAKSSLGGALDDEEGSRVLEAVQKLVPELVESFISSPMELWRFLHIFSNLLHLPESTRCYDMTVDLMSQVGFKMMETDAYVASGLFMEYGLPKLVPLLSSRPPKRRRLLEMSYCFCSQLYHLKFIKSMQDALNDMPTFLHCIVVAMHQEQDFTHDLLDLYLYYAMVALGQQSASLRAAALSMLVIVAEKDESNGPTLVMPVLDKLRALKDDTWWEVSAQLVRLLAALLSNKTAALSQADDIQSLVIEILEKMQSPLAKKVAVSALAPLRPLTSGQPRLEQLYLEVACHPHAASSRRPPRLLASLPSYAACAGMQARPGGCACADRWAVAPASATDAEIAVRARLFGALGAADGPRAPRHVQHARDDAPGVAAALA